MNAREWFGCRTRSVGWGGGSYPRGRALTTHSLPGAGRITFAWVPIYFFLVLLLLALLSLFASVRAGFCCSVGHFWVFFCLLLFSVCCLLRESFAVLEQCYSTAFVPRTLRSLIFFHYSERFVFYLFLSVVSFADFILLRYLVIFCFFIKDSLFDQL